MEKTEKHYKQLSSEERATIMLMTREGKGVREVGRFLKRSPSTSTAQDHNRTRDYALLCIAFRPSVQRRHPEISEFRGSMAGLSVSPVNASLHTSRCATHDSGSRRFATPFLYRTFTDYHLPVCAGAHATSPTTVIDLSELVARLQTFDT